MNRVKNYYYLLWIIGAFVIVYFGNNLLDYFSNKTSMTFDLKYSLWGTTIVSFITGVYLGFINGFPRRFKINKLIAILFIPSFIVWIYPIASFYLKIPFPCFSFYLKLAKYDGQFFFGMISGMTLITGLFETNGNQKR